MRFRSPIAVPDQPPTGPRLHPASQLVAPFRWPLVPRGRALAKAVAQRAALRRLLPMVVALFTAALPAQTSSGAARPHFHLDTFGPDGWRLRLGPTNAGSMLASEQARGRWQPLLLPLLGEWRRLFIDEAGFAARRGHVLGYGGRIQIGWSFAAEDRWYAAMVLHADGSTDLAALAAEIAGVQRASLRGAWRETEVDGVDLSLFVDGSTVVSAPVVSASHLLLVGGDSDLLDDALAIGRAFAAEQPPATRGRPDSPAVELHVDVGALLAATAGDQDEDWQPLAAVLGLHDLGMLRVAVTTAGPQVRIDVDQEFTGPARGLLAALMPPSPGVSTLVRLRPQGPGSWKVGRFDWGATYRVALDVMRHARGDVDAAAEAELAEVLGIDPATDLLPHMTDEFMFTGSPFGGLDDLDEATWTLAFRLRDEARFRTGFDRLLAKTKPYLNRRETVKKGEVAMNRYGNLLGYDVWFAVGHGLLLAAGGRDAEERLGLLVEAAAAARAAATGPAEAPVDPAFTALQRHLPPGCNGLSFGDLDAVLAMPSEWWFVVGGWLLWQHGQPAVDDLAAAQGELRELLRAHDLLTIRTASGWTAPRWSWRLYW